MNKTRRIKELGKEVASLKAKKEAESNLQIILNLQKQVDEYERAFGDLLILLSWKGNHRCIDFENHNIKSVFKMVYDLKKKVYPNENQEGETGLNYK